MGVHCFPKLLSLCFSSYGYYTLVEGVSVCPKRGIKSLIGICLRRECSWRFKWPDRILLAARNRRWVTTAASRGNRPKIKRELDPIHGSPSGPSRTPTPCIPLVLFLKPRSWMWPKCPSAKASMSMIAVSSAILLSTRTWAVQNRALQLSPACLVRPFTGLRHASHVCSLEGPNGLLVSLGARALLDLAGRPAGRLLSLRSEQF